jgi:cell division septation protein DedD
MMGNPLYSDDIGKMCYNAAKNWAITWYDNAKLLINPLAEPSTTVNLVGIAEYNNRPNNEPVVVKLETGLADKFYIGFNRAIGANAQNDEADDEVTIVKANSDGTSQSYLQAHLIQGESHTIGNFAGTGKDLVITANTIDTSTSPGRANVSIVYQSGPTAAPTFAPTASPTASPTSFPTKSPTPAPTEPTPAPTTAAPTKSPTPAPTQNCTQLGKTQCQTLSYCSWSGKNKVCSFNTSSPVSSPVAEPPTGGPGPSQCVASGQPCPTDGNTCCFGCQLKGKNANTCK